MPARKIRKVRGSSGRKTSEGEWVFLEIPEKFRDGVEQLLNRDWISMLELVVVKMVIVL
jgi:hypothetical protein